MCKEYIILINDWVTWALQPGRRNERNQRAMKFFLVRGENLEDCGLMSGLDWNVLHWDKIWT